VDVGGKAYFTEWFLPAKVFVQKEKPGNDEFFGNGYV